MEPLKHKLISLTFIVLLFVIFTQGAEPSFGCKIEKPARPDRSFEQLRSELLELDMSNFDRSLSPYKIWLIRFWRGQYVLLLDVDSFIGALDSWKQRGNETIEDFSELYYDSQYLYFIDLVDLIQHADLSLHEKEFLELFLIYILSQSESRLRSGYQLNILADNYLSNHPDSPYRRFVQDYIQIDLPPRLWTFGISYMFLGAMPFGNISDYFKGQVGFGVEMPVSYRNIVLTPSICWAWGSVNTSFSYDGEDWEDLFTAFSLDLSIGYRAYLSPTIAMVPQGGLGLFRLWERPGEEEGEFGFKPTASFGLAFEFLYHPVEFEDNGKLAFGVTYKRLLSAWENRFDGSEIVLWLAFGSFTSF